MTLADLRKRFANFAATESDLGLGDKVARSQGTRLINADGTFNVVRKGKSFFAPYQNLVEMVWWRFILLTTGIYVACNLIFATGFMLIGVASLTNVDPDGSFWYRYANCFYFSVQTFTTVGYGIIAPVGVAANALATLLALFGWCALAVATGLFFARFSRPRRMVIFSERAIVTPPVKGLRSLQFRIANKRDTNLINLHAKVVLTWLEESETGFSRHFAPLLLERDSVPLFPLNWTIVHPVTEQSPMRGWSKDEYCRRHSELLIMIEGYDRTFAQTVHINNSYIFGEIEWDVRFQPMYFERERMTELHLDRIHLFSAAEEE